MSNTRETIERLRRLRQEWRDLILSNHGTDPNNDWLNTRRACVEWQLAISKSSCALLDIAEAAERLRGAWHPIGLEGCEWLTWDSESSEFMCAGCGCYSAASAEIEHAPTCPAIALDRALDALGGE